MSSYFVNSFSGRYPNGPDYQLLNYGSGSSLSGSYRDPAAMHTGSYGYNYNGMDLSVNRSSASSSHFGAVGESSRAFPAPAQEPRFRQAASSCSLSSPESLPCTNGDSHGAKPSASSPSDQATPASSSANFTEIDEASASSEPEEAASQLSSPSLARAQPEPMATSTAAPEGQTPQIFPWMRKLHISHGNSRSGSLFFFVFSAFLLCVWVAGGGERGELGFSSNIDLFFFPEGEKSLRGSSQLGGQSQRRSFAGVGGFGKEYFLIICSQIRLRFDLPSCASLRRDEVYVTWGRVLLAPKIWRLCLAEEGRAANRAFQGQSATALLPPGVSGRLSPAKGEAQGESKRQSRALSLPAEVGAAGEGVQKAISNMRASGVGRIGAAI
uniref:Homeobox B5 n=1 Tax=Sus scrofa TaxID=9823 RepID=A0A4X1UKL8_PIG